MVSSPAMIDPPSPTQNDTQSSVSQFPEEPEWLKTRQFLTHDFLKKQTGELNVAQGFSLESLPSKVQEYIIIEELLNCLMGFEGKYIRCVSQIETDQDSYMTTEEGLPITDITLLETYKYSLLCEIDSSLHDMVNRILPLCEKHTRVSSFLEKRSGYGNGLVCQAFCSALRALEKEYLMFINQLDLLFKQDQISLQKLYYHLQTGAWKTIEILDRLVGEILKDNAKGGSLLNVLQNVSRVISSDEKTQKLFNFIFTKSCAPYFEMIESWIFKGEIEDLYEEFFVEENKNVRKEQLLEDFNSLYWDSKYSITREVPFFLTKLSDKVLTCGKYLSLLKECGQRVDKRIVDRINFADGKAISIIEEAHNHAAKQVLDYFFGDVKVMDRLKSIKYYFLFDHGDFFVHFMDTAEQENELAKKSTDVSLSKLQSSIEFAAKTCSIPNDEYKDNLTCSLKPMNLANFLSIIKQLSSSNRLDAAVLEQQQLQESPIEGYEAFCLEYKAEWPMSLIINRKNITKYQILFRHLFCFKYAERCLCNTWINHKFSKELKLGTSFSTFYALRHKMIHFIQHFLSYALIEVVEKNWVEMEKKIKTATSIDEVIKSHDQFLDSSLNGCLVSSTDAFKCLTKLVSCCNSFSKYMNQFSTVISNNLNEDVQESDELTDKFERRRERIEQASELAKNTVQDDNYRRAILKFTQVFETTLNQLRSHTAHIFTLSMSFDKESTHY
ncbi:spindle pole body protein spc97 [Naegleria gruberi]|uniref:Spindle pole body component n=1 Tax=Naegleria gruberi TaxID=5762 RepID=D2VDZ3_NAEGR|nr:spindle pole body protein spc97 [Naegleria gruberi]EFC44984.1 spindle pole body protein spc97 [Naegleria gruberi]|eukprot:XP_002677728.1 spindle pole body protein spc97 [Naegleria gruberi strain NEG-M]